MTGMIAPKVNYDDKALEVRSATASEVQEYPMLVIEHHPNGTPISVNGTTNPIFEPFPHVTPPRTPSPVIRFQANIVGESLIMVWCIDHRAMDGSAGLAVVKAFATLCQDPTAPCDVLFPTPDKNKKARKYLMEIKSLSQPYSVKWPFKPSGCRGSGLHSKRPLISSSLLLDPLKIELLRKACEYARESVCHHKNEVCHPPLATLSVLCALAGILGAQARSKAIPGEQAHSSNIIFAANVRRVLGLPRTYLGNAFMHTSTDCNDLPPMPESLQYIPILGPATPQDIWRVCAVALDLQTNSAQLKKEGVEGAIATVSRTRDWSSFQPGYGLNMSVSDITAGADYVYGNWGPLGELLSADLPCDKIPGMCWILPSPPGKRTEWRLRIILEDLATKCLLEHPLLRWASTKSPERHSKI